MMKYDFDKVVDRRGTGSIKWDTGARKYKCDSDDFIPLWIADTDFEICPAIPEAIKKRCDHPILGYTNPTPSYAPAVVDWFNRRYGTKLEPNAVQPSFSVMTAIYFAIMAVTEPGDKIIIMPPVYDPFYNVVTATGRVRADCPLIHEGTRYTMDLEKIEIELKAGAKAVLLCSPHNPVSRVWTKEELQALADLCEKYSAYILSDEVHCDIALFGHPFVSMLTFDNICDRTAVFTGTAKTFNLAGTVVSNVLCPNQELKTKINNSLRAGFCKTPCVLGLVAAEAAYTYAEDWLEQEKTYLEENSRFVQDFIREKMPRVKVTDHEGTYLMWLDMSCFGLGTKLADTIVQRTHVAMGGGAGYGAGCEEYMRLNIGVRRAVLADALERISGLYAELVK